MDSNSALRNLFSYIKWLAIFIVLFYGLYVVLIKVPVAEEIDDPHQYKSILKSLMFNSTGNISGRFAQPLYLPVVLGWTKFFGLKLFEDTLLKEFDPAQCFYKCIFSDDTDKYASDASIFVLHARDLNENNLPPAKPTALKAFLLVESAIYSDDNYKNLPVNYFNLSITYRTDSDIFFPYDNFEKIDDRSKQEDVWHKYERGLDKIQLEQNPAWDKTQPDKIQLGQNPAGHNPAQHHVLVTGAAQRRVLKCIYGQEYRSDLFMGQILRKLKNKTNLALQFVSNCNTNSKRELYVEQLKKFMKITEYGKCNNNSCPGKECLNEKIESHLFYLAFENSVCKQYVTEKFWNIKRLIVPVVLKRQVLQGLGIPDSAYISADDFASPRELAARLLYLQAHPKEYLSHRSALNQIKRQHDEIDYSDNEDLASISPTPIK